MSEPSIAEAQAEEVRAYLVTLRGGSPFLSPADGHLLVGWLEAGVPVGAILRSLDRAARARRARKLRAPLMLRHARQWLGRETGARATRLPADLGALVPAAAELDPAGELLGQTRQQIAALDLEDPEARALAACACAARFFEALWALAPVREPLLAAAAAELAELAPEVEAGAFAALCEDLARYRLRERYPSLTATHIWTECGLGQG